MLAVSCITHARPKLSNLSQARHIFYDKPADFKMVCKSVPIQPHEFLTNIREV
jgi:hypothetical protein